MVFDKQRWMIGQQTLTSVKFLCHLRGGNVFTFTPPQARSVEGGFKTPKEGLFWGAGSFGHFQIGWLEIRPTFPETDFSCQAHTIYKDHL